MEELLEKIAGLLEVDSVDASKKFKDYEEWDSFTRLSVLAMLDTQYHIQMSYKELEDFESIGAFCTKILG